MNLVVLYGGKHDEIAKALEGTAPLSLHICDTAQAEYVAQLYIEH